KTMRERDGSPAGSVVRVPMRAALQLRQAKTSVALVGAFLALDELYLIAVRVFHEGNDSGAVFHGASFADDLASTLANAVTGGVGIRHLDGNVAVRVAQLVFRSVPVMG